MRTHLPKLLLAGVGGGIAAYLFARKRSVAPASRRNPMAADPADPVQSFDELNQIHLDELDVDAMSIVDIDDESNLASVESSIDAEAMELDSPEDTTLEVIEPADGDAGDRYTDHTPRAQDLEHPDDDRAMDAGQNWVEALETSAAENGPLPEQPIDNILDEEDLYAAVQTSDSDDIPVADRGSGGPGGI